MLKLIFLVSLLAILGISWRYFAENRFFQGEYYFLLLVSFIGMLIMPSARGTCCCCSWHWRPCRSPGS